MNFGNAWKEFMGECSKETAFEMMDVRKMRLIEAVDLFTPSDVEYSTSTPKVATSSTQPTATRTARARNGLANGWKLAA